MTEIAAEEPIQIPDVLPVLPVRDVVVFPYIIMPLSVSHAKSVEAVERALGNDRLILLLSQKDDKQEDPGAGDLYGVGTVAAIMRMLKLPDNRIRILVQGVSRARVEHLGEDEPFLQARLENLDAEDEGTPDEDGSPGEDLEPLLRSVRERLDHAATLGKDISPDVLVVAASLTGPGRLADLAASNLDLRVQEAQELLEVLDPLERLKKVSGLLTREIQVLTMQQEISAEARGEMDRSQREYFLRQQLRTIQGELGEFEELADEVEGYRQAAQDKGLPEAA